MTDRVAPSPISTELRLRPLRQSDEAAVRSGHEVMRADDFEFALGLDLLASWRDYLVHLDREHRGLELPDGRVPATFLVAEVDGTIVGRTSIRHALNDFLRREGGHIGYGVLPHWRRQGLATQILRQSLVVARAVGVDDVLVVCDDDNAASATVIERCGGRLGSRATLDDETPIRRYWFR